MHKSKDDRNKKNKWPRNQETKKKYEWSKKNIEEIVEFKVKRESE